MDELRVKSIIESILFVSDRPITARDIADVLGEGFDAKGVRRHLEEMIAEYENRKGGIFLREVAGGFQLYTNPENAEYLKKLIDVKPFRLSRAALETLAIVAYRQPVTKSEVEEIRGVDSSGALRVLIEKKLVRIVGKKDEPGRPFLYGTTKEFLEFFDLKSLADLPTLKDLEQIAKEINEESGASAPVQSQDNTVKEGGQVISKDIILKEDTVSEEPGQEQIQEETIVSQFEEALRKVETSNKSVKETLGLSDKENKQDTESADYISKTDNSEQSAEEVMTRDEDKRE
ncbi:MAG: SMC-Scp complex subunit ScpB [Deltaproteobacteria bacterium]|nr:SMC-Scp complex subunit ScpB [Deltaproteobacteria bacterium]